MSLLKLGVEDASLSAAFVAEDSCEPVESQVRLAAGGAASLSYSCGTHHFCTSNCYLKLSGCVRLSSWEPRSAGRPVRSSTMNDTSKLLPRPEKGI